MNHESPKAEPTKTEAPQAIEAIPQIAEVVIAYRADGKPTLGDVVKIANRAAGLLRLDAHAKMAIENAA